MDAKAIRMLRARLGWTQTRFAETIGVSQPLVSAWESGRRQPEGPARHTLRQLATTLPSAVQEQRPPREVLLTAALSVLQQEDTPPPASAADFLSGYRQQMEDQIDAFERVHRQQGTPHPRLAAYLDQAAHGPGATLGAEAHREAMRAFLTSPPEVIDQMGRWYRGQLACVLTQEPDPQQRAELEVLMLAVDALWFLDLLGLRQDTVASRSRILNTARQMAGIKPK